MALKFVKNFLTLEDDSISFESCLLLAPPQNKRD